MTGRRTLLVVAALLLAAIGTSLVWLYVQGAETRAREEVQSSVELRPVYVTTAAADAGTLGANVPTTKGQVSVALAADAVTPSEVAQLRLAIPVRAGTVLRSTMFTSGAVSGVANGKQAVSITIGDPQRVPALLQKGDDVAIYAYSPRETPELILSHVLVQTVGPGPANAGVPPTIVGFEASPEDVRKIVDLAASGRTPQLVINGSGVLP